MFITPIISRDEKGYELAEVGASGGESELGRTLDLESFDQEAAAKFIALCQDAIPDSCEKARVLEMLSSGSGARSFSLNSIGLYSTTGAIRLEDFARSFAGAVDLDLLEGRHTINSSRMPHPRSLPTNSARTSRVVSGVSSAFRLV